MKSLIISAFVLLTGTAFGQTVTESNSLDRTPAKGQLVSGTTTGFMVVDESRNNPVLQSNKRDAAPTQNVLYTDGYNATTVTPQTIKKDEPKR